MKNLKVSAKLIVSFFIVIALAVVIGAVGIIGMLQLNRAQSAMFDDNLVAIEAMANLREVFGNERSDFRNIFINEYFLENDSFDLEAAIAKFDQYKKTTDESFALYETTIDPNADESAYYSAKEMWVGPYADMKAELFPMMRAGQWDEAYNIFINAGVSIIPVVTTGFATSTEQNNLWAQEADAMGNSLYFGLTLLLVIVLAVAVAISLFFAMRISGLISKPAIFMKDMLLRIGTKGDLDFTDEEYRQTEAYAAVKDEIGESVDMLLTTIRRLAVVGHALESVSDGDLTVELSLLSERDTMGRSLIKMIDNLNNMFGEINNATSQVAVGSKQIADGSQALAQGSTEQAAAVEQLSSSIFEIAQKTKENSEMADKAATLANTIKGNAEKGSRQMDEMMNAVKDINEASQSINKVIKVIDDIAFQTNILALNAAVEAARAGQHGKGFAVVAEEVRNLAAKSAEAAKDTGSLIANSMEKAEMGARIAGETAVSLADIVMGINESTQLVGDIAKSSEEQSTGIEQINKGINQVAQVVQQNSATAEESAAASEEMSGQANMLEELVSQYKIKDGGRRALSSPAPHRKQLSMPSKTAYSPHMGGDGKY